MKRKGIAMPNRFQEVLEQYTDRDDFERIYQHRCPSAVQDLYDAAAWYAMQASAWNYDPDRLAVARAAWDKAEWARDRLTVGTPADKGAITRKRNKAAAALNEFYETHPEGATYLAALAQAVEILTAARDGLELAAIAFACEPTTATGMALEQAFRALADAEANTSATVSGHETEENERARGLVANAKEYRQALGAEIWADIEATEGTNAYERKLSSLQGIVRHRASGVEHYREIMKEEESKHAEARADLAAFLSQVEQRKGLTPEAADTMAALALLAV